MFPITWNKSKIMHATSEVLVNNPIARQTGALESPYERSGILARDTTFREYQEIKVIWDNSDLITCPPNSMNKKIINVLL